MGTNFTGYFELGDLNTIKIAPMKFFAIDSEDENVIEGLVAPYIEAGSTWKLTPIVLQNDTGGEETQGYNFEVTIIIPNGEHHNVERIIKHYQNNPDDLDFITIGFSQAGEQVKGFYLPGLDYNNPVNSFPIENNEMKIYPELTMTLDIEPADMRNRTKIVIKKYFPLDEDYADTIIPNIIT